MAKNSVTFSVKINDDGTYDLVSNKAKKLRKEVEGVAAATEKGTKKRNAYNRQEKGVAQNTSNSTKAFAKQAQTIRGGLVPAYATLAANVFAATATFTALSNAAALQQLEAGLVAVGNAAGQNLPYVAQQLKAITGEAVTTQSAMQATALAVSSGFSVAQLEDLTRVAKGASLALGRDMEDALNRLVRGTAKLEPEILDELGIMVRLDDAVEAYAEQLGKTGNQLTQFERRQAFLNATTEQGIKKFGEIAEVIDPNPYNQLRATFDGVVKSILNLVNTALTPLAKMFSMSPVGVGGAMLLFGSTIAGQMIPALTDMAEKSYESADALAEQAKKSNDSTRAKKLNYLATIKGNQADAIAAAGQGKLGESLRFVRATYISAASASTSAAASSGVLSTAFTTLRASSLALATAIRSVGAAFFAFMPYLGLAITAFGLLMPLLEKMFGKGKLEKETEEVISSFSSFSQINDKLKTSLEKTTDSSQQYTLKARAVAGVTDQVYSAFKRLSGVSDSIKLDRVQQALEEVKKREEELFRVQQGIYGSSVQAEKRLQIAKDRHRAAVEALGQLDKEVASNVLKNAIEEIEANETLNAAMGAQVSGYQALLAEVQTGNLTQEEFAQKLQLIRDSAANITATIDGATDAFSLFNRELIKVGNQATGPFDDLVRQGNLIKTELANLPEEAKGSFLAGLGGIFKGASEEDVTRIVDNINEVNNLLVSAKANQELIAVSAKRLSAASKEDANALKVKLALERAVVLSKIDALDKEFALKKELLGTKLTEAAIQQYRAQRLALTGELLTDEQIMLRVAAKRVEVEGKLLAISQKITKANNARRAAQIEEARLLATGAAASGLRPRTALNEAEELKVLRNTRSLRETNIKNEFEMRRQNIQQAFNEEKARLEQLEGLSDQQLKARIERENQARLAALTAADKEEEVAKNRLTIEEKIAKLKAGQAALAAAGAGDTTAERIAGFGDAGGFENIQLGADKVKALSLMISPMVEDLKKLGPEGELVAAVAQGGFMISESWAKVGDTFANSTNKMERAAAVAGAVANTLSAIGSIAKASSDARIAGIDSEIAAEKKRDGKSSESLAKIQQLEAKKEKMKREAFETDKKIKLATAVANTAAGITQALASLPPPYSFIMAGITAAMGAAQIGIISSMSYQGGSAQAPQAAAPSQIAIGQRQSSVDLARSSSAVGEIGYMRGEQGVGSSASNFRPAFTGMKYRASGGAVAGYMVGEQGPEMFVPDVPGRIVPADETGAAGGVSNVNFTINAVDSTGIEEVLVSQRGNIIGMLREAANAHGQEFLEAVDVSVYAAPNRRTV